MTTVEKRRSGRKSGRHRKQSDGGYSDTSSGGSFLDENDREVSNLTDRAFRSLCIGDEAVYNDSDLGLSSPCSQRDRQLAFSHSGHDGDREELKRAAHENFSLRVQQYEQDWIHGGMYGAEIHRDPQWGVYGERTQGRVSATFQHSFVDAFQQEKSLREEQLSFFSNGATELNSQQPRSRSRVSSLIRAFNSEGHRDDSGMDDRFKEWNNETSWDKSALMSFQRELSEFSTSYQQNFNSGHFPTCGPFSPQDNNFYSSEVKAMAHMSHNSATSFMGSSHSKHSMSAEVNCNSNFFIHSEFSPFKVWRDHNRFPFQHGQVSGFMHNSDFSQWYETPMYKEISIGDQPQGNYRGIRQGHLAPVVPPMSQRSTSTSTMLQKAPSVEKRCESELAGHYPQWKRTQNMGTNRLQSQRPSTASPTIEMSRRVRDTISSVKALQQKIKMMTEHNITTGVINPQGGIYGNENLIPFGNNGVAVAPNVVSNNTSTTPFNISQLLTPSVYPHQEAEMSDHLHYDLSAEPVEHAPVRAESRGATPDVRTSSYKTRATSLLFNLKDNRKRVKSTYSPTKFKGLEIQEKSKHPPTQEPRDTVIDIPDFPDPHNQYALFDESNRINAQEYASQYQSPMTQPAMAHSGQFPSYSLSEYQAAQMQGQMVHHSGFTGFIPENYTSNQLTNGQNLHEDLTSFAPNKEGVIYNVGPLEGDVYKLNPGYSTTEPPRLNVVDYQSEEYLKSKGNTEQLPNDMVGRGFTEGHRYEQPKDNKHDDVSSQGRWRQTNSQAAREFSLKADFYPLKQETAALLEEARQPSITKEPEKVEFRESFDVSTPYDISNQMPSSSFSNETLENPAHYGQQQPMTFQDNNALQKYYGQYEDNQKKEIQSTHNYNRYTDQEYPSQNGYYYSKDKLMAMEGTDQPKQYAPIREDYGMQSLQQAEAKPQLEPSTKTSLLNKPDRTYAPVFTNFKEDGHITEVKSKQVIVEDMKTEITQAELANAKQCTQMIEVREESAGSILAGEKVEAEQAKSKQIQQETLNQTKPENIEKEKIKDQTTSKQQLEQVKEGHKKAEQATAQQEADEVQNIKDKTEDKHLRDEVGNQVEAEQKGTEKVKEEHKLAKIDLETQAQIKQAQLQQAKETPVNARLVQDKELSKGREAEQFIKENVNREKDEKDRTVRDDIQMQQTKELQTKAEQEKTKIVDKENFKADQIKTWDVKQSHEENLIQKVQVETMDTAKEIHSAKEANAEKGNADQVKLEQTKEERFKAGLTKVENMLGKSDKLLAKLTGMQQAKTEPDKVQQVKTELAKAKAELAKIKEKMRGEQKEKVRNVPSVVKDNDIANNTAPLGRKVNENQGDKKEEQPEEVQKQKEDLAVRKVIGQPDRGADDYDRLREKYGFTQAALTNKKLVSETEALSVDKVETVSEEKSSDNCSLKSKVSGGNKENMKEESNSMVSEVTESQYVYSESSKEFKLSSVNDTPSISDKKVNNDNIMDKVKDYDMDKPIKSDPVKDPDVALKKESKFTKHLTSERKTKPTERSIAPTNDQHMAPPKVLPQKERDQTKQEMLTSKIKAHAEKEISAMKEKGFAKRDGSKMSTKQLASSQSVTVRQKPPSQDVYVKNESTTSSGITPKHQKEAPAVVQLEVLSPQSEDHLQKQDPQKIPKSNNDEQEPPSKTFQPEGYSVNTINNLVENEKQENQAEMESAIQTKEQPPEMAHREIQVKLEDNSGKQEEELKDKLPVNTNFLSKKREDLISSGNPTIPESEPSVALVLGHKEASVPDENLQIMGIMVSVHERNPHLEIDHGNNNTLNLINSTEKAPSKENSQENTKDLQKTQSIPLKDEAKAEKMQENSTLEIRQNKMAVDVIKTNLQPEDSSTKADTQLETQPVAENGVTVTVPAKNKVLAETHTLLNHHILATEMKDQAENKSTKTDEVKSEVKTEEKTPSRIQTRQTNDNLIPEVGNTVINKKHNANTPIIYGVPPSVKEDISGAINQSRSSNSDDKSATRLKEKRSDSTPPKAFNEASPSKNSTGNENKCVSPKHQPNETHIGDVNQEDGDVHIDSVAIRIVPAGPKDKNEKVISSSDVVLFNGHKQVTSSGCKEKANILKTEGMSKVFGPATTENAMIDNLTDRVGVQSAFSSVSKVSDSYKTNNQQSSTNGASDNTHIEDGNPAKAKTSETLQEDSNTQHVEEDYFQVHGVRDTSNEVKELSEIMQNKTAVSKKAFKEEKNEAFVFKVDQDKSKTVESSSVKIQNDSMRIKNCETEDKLPSILSDGSMERWSTNEKMEQGQPNQIRRHHTDNNFSLSAKERQTSSPHPTRKKIQEKPEAKPRQKERVSTIPEISALADYARLKVIVSEENDVNPVQEFPPNKKEGFFPLIHTRHSRRPVFTVDPQEHSVKVKTLPNKTETDAKVNKEPKAVVFPITEKEHQRTGMFKLGDKESGQTHAHNIDKKSPATSWPSSGVSQPKNTSEGWTHPEKASPSTPAIVQTRNKTENLVSLRKEGSTDIQQNKDRGVDTNKLLNERSVIKHKETRAGQQGKIKELEENQASQNQEEKQEHIRIKQMVEEKRAFLAEEEKRALQREEERRARDRETIAIKIKERREKQKEAEKRAEEERKAKQKEEERPAQKEEEIRTKQKEEKMKMTENEQTRGRKIEEEIQANLREHDQQKRDNEWARLQKQEEEKTAQEEQQKLQEQQQRREAQKEQQRKAAQEEQQRRTIQEEQQRRKAQEELKRKVAQEEQQQRAKQEEQKRKAAQEEQKRRAALFDEQQRKAAQEEQQRRAAREEKQRRAAEEEQRRREAEKELQRRAVQEEQKRRAAQEEQKREAQKEQQRRAAQEEQQRRAAQEEQQRRAAQEEQQRRAAQEEQQRRAAQEEQQRRAAQEEQQRRAAQDEKQKRAAKEEQEKRAEQKEQQRRTIQEQQKRVEEKQQRTSQEERKRQATEEEQEIRAAQEEQPKRTAQDEQRRRAAQEQRRRALQEENQRAAQEEQQRRAAQEEQQTRVPHERQWVVEKGDDSQTKMNKEEERLATYQEDLTAAPDKRQRQAAQKDVLQYYAITSAESEKKPRERQLYSPSPSQQRNNPTGLESTDRQYRPHAPPSPAPSLPRSTTSSPALGGKPLMFRVKDNTMKGSSLTKSVKPRFHKNFGEDVRGGSPMDRRLEMGEAEQEIMRRSAGTPVHPDTGLNRLAPINDSSTPRSASSSLGYSTPVSHHRPYSRRSIVMDEDDSRSVISTMSEDVESIATSAADLAELRGLYDSDRPESACSFSSDVSRLGKPPTVPPKSEKALRRAQRLTTRRIKKELSKLAESNPAEVQREVSITDSTSSSNEVCSPNRNAVTSPHFSSPVSLAHAPTAGSSLHSSYIDHQSSNRSFHASPHATGPISIPNSSSHATAAISLPAAAKSVAHVPSSPTLHHANHPAPVTQYHVESSYPQAYPLTQRKVLQDLGSGQYFVVDVPVQVKTKTFIDPETGKYVQLNVRESGQKMSRPPPQQKFPQPQLQPQIKSQQEPSSQAPTAGKPIAFHQGYHGHPHSYQPHQQPHLSSEPGTPQQDQHPVRESQSYGHQARETGQTTEGHRYSPEKTPYMDTVNNKDKMHTVYDTHGSYESFPECDTNSQLAGGSVCQNENSAHSQYQPRDIITMGELEDFMEVSDW